MSRNKQGKAGDVFDLKSALRGHYLGILRKKWPALPQNKLMALFPEVLGEGEVLENTIPGISGGVNWAEQYELSVAEAFGHTFRQSKGVFYTPEVMSRYIAERLFFYHQSGKKAPRVMDPACGAGALLVPLYITMKKQGFRPVIYGADIDSAALLICRYQLALAELERVNQPEEFRIWLAKQRIVLTEMDFLHSSGWPEVDIIIGNPPFVGFRRYTKAEKDYLAGHFFSYEGKADLWYYFLEKSLLLLAEGGVLAFVLPRYFQHAHHSRKLRLFLTEKAEILEITEGDGKLTFKQAQNHCCLLFLRRKTGPKKEEVLFRIAQKNGGFQEALIPSSHLAPEGWRFLTKEAANVITALERISVDLTDVAGVANGILTGLDRLQGGPGFVVTEAEAKEYGLEQELLKPWYKSKDIHCYKLEQTKLRLLYLTPHCRLEAYPKTLAYLQERQEALRERKCGFSAWWALARPKVELPWTKPKLLSPYRAKENLFAVDLGGGHCSLDGTLVFPHSEEDLWFLAGLLNSRLLSVIYSLQSKRMGALREYYPHDLGRLKIPWKLPLEVRGQIAEAARYLYEHPLGEEWDIANIQLNERINMSCGIDEADMVSLNWLHQATMK